LKIADLIRYTYAEIRNISRFPFSGLHSNKSREPNLKEYNSQRKLNFPYSLCYAPFTNLYFGFDGKISSCCYNRTDILGQYPVQSISEAWKGKSIVNFRKQLKKYELPKGCHLCKNLLEEKAFHSVLAKNYDDNSVYSRYPTMMEFELSNTCNMACIMCDGRYSSVIRSTVEKLPPLKNPYDKQFVEQLKEYIPHLVKTKYLGGEPFLINIYYDIWEQIIRLNPSCVLFIQTNGSVLNQKIKQLLDKGNFHFNISLDAITKETFEKIRINGDFETVMANIIYFHDYCKSKNAYFGISICPVKQNWKEIPHIIEFCNKREIELYFNRVWRPAECSLWNSSTNELNEIYLYYSSIILPEETTVQKQNKIKFEELTEQISQWIINIDKVKEQNTFFENADISTLLHLLTEKTKKHLLEHDLKKDPDKFQKAELLTSELIKIITHFEKEENYKTMLIKLHEIPVEILAREMANNSPEVLMLQAQEFIRHQYD
jgi:MoaA/NifB/PqqE/SkfB family radical SAM enzyme